MRVASSVALITVSLVTSLSLGVSTFWLTKLANRAPADACGLPAGVASTDSEIARRAMACRDLEQGRISLAEYRQLAGIAVVPVVVEPPISITSLPVEMSPAPLWATTVRAVSTEWSATSWSAQNVLGPPDVYPAHGDLPKAWASREADATTEFIEVGFGVPKRLHSLNIIETFNPGAIESVELVTISGKRIQIQSPPNTYMRGATSNVHTVDFTCTDEPIVGARVTLASSAVTGWNEIDAIGALACP